MTELPWGLLISWGIFFGFLNTHIRHSSKFQGSSRKYEIALSLSVIFGFITMLALLILYFLKVSWYNPIILIIFGGVIGGIIFGFLDALVGLFKMSLLSFVGWPVSAIWVYINIHRLSL